MELSLFYEGLVSSCVNDEVRRFIFFELNELNRCCSCDSGWIVVCLNGVDIGIYFGYFEFYNSGSKCVINYGYI